DPDVNPVVTDLKFVFPIFVEDFIQHIYMEEDTLFHYINLLDKASRKEGNLWEVYSKMEKFSIQQFAIEHDVHDDDMEGITQITDNFKMGESDHLLLKVALSELKNFQNELSIHAKIENEILFPKALELEKKVKNII